MEENDNHDTEETPSSPVSKVFMVIGGLLFLVFVIHYGIKTFRNNSYREVSERFIRHNATLKNEVGDIVRVSSGRAFKNDNGEWEITREVVGSNKKVLVTVMVFCNQGSSDPGVGCTLKRATYNAENEAPNEIPITLYDNILMVYR